MEERKIEIRIQADSFLQNIWMISCIETMIKEKYFENFMNE